MEPEMMELFFEIHSGLPRESPGRDEDTRRAFRMLPALDRPRILDVGCGPGGQTLALARLSGGTIVALDNHQPYLDAVNRRAASERFSDRIETVNRSMFEMSFPDQSFDVVWAEGSIYIIGFDRGLTEWRRLIRPDGFLVVNEAVWLRPDPPDEIFRFWDENYPGIRSVPENLEQIGRLGYEAIGNFTLTADAWMEGYYLPLEKRVERLRAKYAGNPEAMALLDSESREIDLYRRYGDWYGYEFFVMKKAGD
jgi:ubiquinone/menaquinone biosynthesis C-methylase UbiE